MGLVTTLKWRFQSCVSVNLSVYGVGGPHVTITQDAWDVTLQDNTPDPSHTTKHQPVLTSGGVATKARTVCKVGSSHPTGIFYRNKNHFEY